MIRFTSLFIFVFALTTNFAYCQRFSDRQAEPLDVQIGQMLNIGFRGLKLADTNHIRRDIEQYHLGGVVLFDYDVPTAKPRRNIQSPRQVKDLVNQLQTHAEIPLMISIDQEGGKVARLKPKYGFPKSVSAQHIGKLNDIDSTRFYALQTAKTLAELGINVNLAPVVDVNINPKNPVIGSLERSYSSDPGAVVKYAAIFIRAMHRYGIITVLKHFPGHGSSKKDSHLGVVDVTHTWSPKELIPYRQLIDSNLVDMVMTAHIFNANIDSTYPATLSQPTIKTLLRDSLHFEGVVISDDLMMGAIRKEYGLNMAIKKTLEAGVDILVFANNSVYDPEIVPKAHRIIKDLVEEGTISKKRINQSYERIMRLKEQLH